ncbi:uncharacterized protein LOC100840352 [Brachypodium distachyon]|uniref:Calmodulin-binding domain-containing protein n=2 Tax=Brachypodium distachyon TaxID=15368 RepID=I1H885_BRADI|nr:uncharacterized protein LOC100840352 [Brachypodium distachyon]XP_010228987.1 uncharacterized protein LOC100840352 [Brachypodium distachyon]KQK22965.1 hypothetical protein BRADI_1g70350v3 [Brachypodium distachyon]KQK22966.1 hypothetical protein BRADI_1g70350v3 [Brachypodium distachyon]|eukprot:XP_003558518.1 uncharacterized protein LOC100840352 [Brachypodium distachyon]
MSKDLERRNTVGSTTPTSLASPSDPSRKDEKTIPRYLRASTGSCHDLCKFGHKNPSEEKLKLSGGRRKKVPAHLNNFALHGSVILDTPKDARNRNISLAKSSISLGEADRIAHKIKLVNLRSAASSEHLVARTTSADHKNANSDGRKKQLMVAPRTSANPRYPDGGPSFDKKERMPVKGSKLAEKALQEKARTVAKASTVKQSSVKRPASFPTKLNMIKQMPVSSQSSSNLISSKDKNILKGKLTSPLTSTVKGTSNSGKTGRNPMRSSNANTNGKEGSDMSRTPLAIESEFTASIKIQEDDAQDSCITGHTVESTVAELFPDATEHVEKSQTVPEETSGSDSEGGLDVSLTSSSIESELTASVETQEDDVLGSCITGYRAESALAEMSSDDTEYVDSPGLALKERSISVLEVDELESNENTEKSEASAAELLEKSIIALGLERSFDDQELETALSKSDLGHMQAQQSSDSRASTDEDVQTEHTDIYQLSEQLTAVQNADVYDSVLTEGSSTTKADGLKVNASVESVTESREDVAAHEDLQGSPELRALNEKHAEDPESCLDCTLGNIAENVKASEVFEVGNIYSAYHSQSILETSSDGELMEERKSLLIEPSDSNVQANELASFNNDGTFEQDVLKPRIVFQQSPGELSDDEFYEEYDFEPSESDQSDAGEGSTRNRNMDESPKASGQMPRRISALDLDDASATPYKLKFKRGKIVELKADSNGPRRLKFRRKAANEVVNGEGQPATRVYKRNITNSFVRIEPDLESPGVKLRHQGTQDKKDAQGLFNNVIEETASKLVGSRKSKVKALVGAFETVILLQDGNPTPSTPQAGNSAYSVHGNEEKAPEEAV